MKYVYVQSVLPQEDVITLKIKSGKSSIKDAIARAVGYYLKSDLVNNKDEKNAQELISLGINKNAAMALTYLQNMNSVTSVDLERGARLRQPEVSVVMKLLRERDWINEREEKKAGKGRPNKIYSLKVRFNDIITQLEKQQKKAVDETGVKVE
jgi:predicted transcriptional regulator